MQEKIFKAYDIRGIYPEEIDEKGIYDIGRGLAFYLEEKKGISSPEIAVGRDARESSPSLAASLIEGLKDGGANVLEMGFCTTPLNYFANWHLGLDASVMVTASHNSSEYNGLKISFRDVKSPTEEGEQEKLKEVILEKDHGKLKKGSIKKKEISDDYFNFLEKESAGYNFSDLKIVADTGNGVLGPFLERLAEMLGLDCTFLFLKPDGSFPNHLANPLEKENLRMLQEEVKKKKADLGLAFDGDGDRVVFLDSHARPIGSDIALGIFAMYFLEKGLAGTIPADLRMSRGVVEEVSRQKGEIVKCRVGYPFIKREMRKRKSFLGGELSGHFFWKDFSYSESALLSTIRMLKIIKEKELTLAQMAESLKTYFSGGETNFKVRDKNQKLKELQSIFANGKQNFLDGLTVEYENWWFNVRPSNTEPLLRLVIEAKSEELLAKKKREIVSLLKRQ